MRTRAYAAAGPESPLGPFELERRDPGPRDVELEIAYCGICHTDIHQTRNEWGGSFYPMVPGHEIVGKVARVGAKVRRFKTGDAAGIGCMVDSCRKCANCRRGLEQHCEAGPTFTYNSPDKSGGRTQGGYAGRIVVDESFALKIGPKQPLERVAPLLCAGITTYSPLKRYGTKRGSRGGVMGLGGLGHMAVKIAAAMGAEVAVLSRTNAKKADAFKLGAHDFIVSSDETAAARYAGTFDLIIDTISADHEIDAPLAALKTGGTLVLVGAPPHPLKVGAFSVLGRKALAGSLIGGVAETQEMLDFCAKRKILADVEVVPMKRVNEAYERLSLGDVRYRFVLDVSTL